MYEKEIKLCVELGLINQVKSYNSYQYINDRKDKAGNAGYKLLSGKILKQCKRFWKENKYCLIEHYKELIPLEALHYISAARSYFDRMYIYYDKKDPIITGQILNLEQKESWARSYLIAQWK